jgi:hypothetical protein
MKTFVPDAANVWMCVQTHVLSSRKWEEERFHKESNRRTVWLAGVVFFDVILLPLIFWRKAVWPWNKVKPVYP